jgi:hypothetical protein
MVPRNSQPDRALDNSNRSSPGARSHRHRAAVRALPGAGAAEDDDPPLA